MSAAETEPPESNRISINVPVHLYRILTPPAVAIVLGFGSGLLSASSHASLQFLAENAHRLPTTIQGWYFYQKTKNYRVLWAGLKGGSLQALRLGAWTSAFVGLQEVADRQLVSRIDSAISYRRTISGALSGAVIATVASSYYRLGPRGAYPRLLWCTAATALVGALQDGQTYLKAHKEHDTP